MDNVLTTVNLVLTLLPVMYVQILLQPGNLIMIVDAPKVGMMMDLVPNVNNVYLNVYLAPMEPLVMFVLFLILPEILIMNVDVLPKITLMMD